MALFLVRGEAKAEIKRVESFAYEVEVEASDLIGLQAALGPAVEAYIRDEIDGEDEDSTLATTSFTFESIETLDSDEDEDEDEPVAEGYTPARRSATSTATTPDLGFAVATVVTRSGYSPARVRHEPAR